MDLQRDYANKLNEITCVFALGQKESSSAILAYYEYAENCWKQSEYFEYSKMVNSASELSEQEKAEKLEKYKNDFLFMNMTKQKSTKTLFGTIWTKRKNQKLKRWEIRNGI